MADGPRHDPAQVPPDEPLDVAGVLVGHEPDAELGQGARRNDPLDPRPSVAAAEAGDRQRRTDRRPLVERIPALAPAPRDAGIAEDALVAGAGTCHPGTLGVVPVAYAVVEARDRDPAAGVVQAGDDLAEGL